MKLKSQLLLRSLCAAALIFGLFGALLIGQVFSLQLQRERQTIDEQSAALCQSLEAGAVNYALQSISLTDELICDLLTQANETASLYAPDASPFFGTHLPDPMPQEGIYVSDGMLSVLRPVRMDGNVYYLLLRSDLSPLYDLRTALIRAYAVLYIALMSVFAWIIHHIARQLTRPLDDLVGISRRLTEGEMNIRASASDCTEINTLSSSFNQMADSLTGQIERQRRFIADLTHEMKTPLTAMLGHAELIRSEQVKGEDSLMSAHRIITEGQRLNALSARLIDLILLEKDEIHPSEVFALHLIEETVLSLMPEAQKRGIILHTRADDALILGEAALLRVLLSNLTDNALKSDADEVILEGHLDGDIYTLSVRDNGRGMDAEALSRITEPFYRVDKSRSRAQGGAGLGLSICLEIARLHHTELTFDSAIGRGTCVSVRLAGKEVGCDA